MIHMTATGGGPTVGYQVVCRCGWIGPDDYSTRRKARTAGDDHLAEANDELNQGKGGTDE